MAKRSKLSTQEQITMKEQEIKTQTELLDKLNLELKELQSIKLQQDKDDLYSMIQNSGYTKEQIEKLLFNLSNKKVEIKVDNQNNVGQGVGQKVEVEDKQAS